MLEDSPVMEKKPNGRPAQPPPKGGVTESKKSLETTKKPFGLYKRRESGGFVNPKNDPLRKTNLPKSGKIPDKRPRPRSTSYSCGKADSKVAEVNEPEIGSVFASGSKKQNLNHLLNFHYTPRAGAVGGNRASARTHNNYPANWLGTQKHKYNKENFLQANCQFIVKENIDYTPHLVDPDLLVDWDAVEQIRVKTAALASCPICLDYPVAAKMTRCGHIYCWSCILHYLALSDKTWRKCPICYEAVHKKDLKSVVTLAYPPYNVGDEICLKLMKRERGTLLPIPVEQSDLKPFSGVLSLTEKELDTVYSKLLLATPDDVMTIIQTEKAELMNSLKENTGCPEMCFIEQALELLREREEFLKKTLDEAGIVDSGGVSPDAKHSDAVVDSEVAQELSTLNISADEDRSRERYESMSSEGCAGSEDDHIFPYEELGVPSEQATKFFYFYQASDGQHVYLQALNIKMLEMQYGKLDQGPLQVRGRIVEKESGSMTEELRKRLRYLNHLPVTCQFEVVEIDLSQYVSGDVLAQFEEELCARAKRRLRREREERKREKKISEEVDLKWGRHPEPNLRIDSHRQFPLCGTGSDETLNSSPASPGLSRSQSLNSLSSTSTAFETTGEFFPTTNLSSSVAAEQSGPSFAQMLKSGAGQKSSRDATKEPPSYNEIWPKPRPSGSDNESSEYGLAPQFRQTLSDAFAAALEKAESRADLEQGTGNKKKKKKKQKVLFVTGTVCSGK